MLGSAASLFESIEAMDQALVRLSRQGGALRFRLGTGLEALGRSGGHHELGFSSVEAYALERCERSARWVQGSRSLVRRLEQLPQTRVALVTGTLGFSMAQLVGQIASTEDEAFWLAAAATRTVREMRQLVRQRARQAADSSSDPKSDAVSGLAALGEGEQFVTLTVRVNREEAWLFEATRQIVRRVAGPNTEETIDALLGEGTVSLLVRMRRDHATLRDDNSAVDSAQERWEAELSRFREEAEARCEAAVGARGKLGVGAMEIEESLSGESRDFTAFEGDALRLDAELRKIAAELAQRDLALGQLAEAFWKADGWRRLGYATEAQYARERLGTSLSSIKAKRWLARRTETLPQLRVAVENGVLGYEAARLVATVATPETVDDWVIRAAKRTVRFLREEVDAAQMLERLVPEASAAPPSETTMQELAELESRIVSGTLFRELDGARELNAAAHPARQTSADASGPLGRAPRPRCARHSGRVTLRFRVSAETRRYYRRLERLYRRYGPPRQSFLRFLCLALIGAWKHALGSSAQYSEIYARDGYRCKNPVCTRRDLTPHHLTFRARGGDDSQENVASLCVWCHLDGIHGGRLSALPPASNITWTIGRSGHTVVRGRHRERAHPAFGTEGR